MGAVFGAGGAVLRSCRVRFIILCVEVDKEPVLMAWLIACQSSAGMRCLLSFSVSMSSGFSFVYLIRSLTTDCNRLSSRPIKASRAALYGAISSSASATRSISRLSCAMRSGRRSGDRKE